MCYIWRGFVRRIGLAVKQHSQQKVSLEATCAAENTSPYCAVNGLHLFATQPPDALTFDSI